MLVWIENGFSITLLELSSRRLLRVFIEIERDEEFVSFSITDVEAETYACFDIHDFGKQAPVSVRSIVVATVRAVVSFVDVVLAGAR